MKEFKIISENIAMADSFIKDRVFCITGTLEVERKHYTEFIHTHGGTVVNHVTDEVDHVLAGADAYIRNTAKIMQAIEEEAHIISEWTFMSRTAAVILERDLSPKPKKKRAPLIPEMIPSFIATATKSIQGIAFCITGELSHGRKSFAMFIKKNGGEFRSTVTKNVQYLIAGDDVRYIGSAKLTDAEKRGVHIISEKDFLNMAGVRSVY